MASDDPTPSHAAEDAGADDVPVPAIMKPKAGRSFRKRKAAAAFDAGEAAPAPEVEAEAVATVHAMRALQKQRQRHRGVTLEAKGELDLEDQVGREDAEPGDVAAVLDATFTQQTEGGDVDPNMLRYIEEEMGTITDETDAPAKPVAKDADSELYETPAFLLQRKMAAGQPEEDREDAQRWLAGIEEVQLGAEEKLINYEETERAKAQMLARLESRMRRSANRDRSSDAPRHVSEPLPGNFTSNFHHHRKSFAMAQRPNGFKQNNLHQGGPPGGGRGAGGGGRGRGY